MNMNFFFKFTVITVRLCGRTVTVLAWTAERPGFESCFDHLSRVGISGVNEPERTGTAFRLEFMQPERRSCSSVTVFENAVPPAEQKVA